MKHIDIIPSVTNDAWLDPIIDRRFYRKKYNAEQVLAQFAATVRDEVDMDKLAAALIGVIEETMQPEKVSLWLKDSNAKTQRREGAKEK